MVKINSSAADKNYLAGIIRILVLAVAFLPMFVPAYLIYPFVSGRNLVFRIISEVLFVLWLWLLRSDHRFYPPKSKLIGLFSIYILIQLIANFFGANFYFSMLSNLERMDGFIALIHWFLFLIVVVSVFNNQKYWNQLWLTLILSGLISGGLGLLEKSGIQLFNTHQKSLAITSTFGNQGVLAVFQLLIFWINIGALYRFRESIYKFPLLIFLVVQIFIFYFSTVRSVFVAILVAVLTAGILAVLYRKKFKSYLPAKLITALKYLPLIVLLFGTLLLISRDLPLFKDHQAFQRITNFDLDSASIKSRLLLWQVALNGFLENPVLGWGQENFYQVLQKYYHPELNFELFWYDRAHNIVLQKLVDGGVMSFLMYFTFFVVMIFYLVKKIGDEKSDPVIPAIVLLAVISYLAFNLFYFEVFESYLYLTLTIGFTVFHCESGQKKLDLRKLKSPIWTIAVFILIISVAGPLQLNPTKQAYYASNAHDTMRYQNKYTNFKNALKYDSFAMTEVREHIAWNAINMASLAEYNRHQKLAMLELAINELRKEFKKTTANNRSLLLLGSVLNIAGDADPGYLKEAELVLGTGIQRNPRHLIFYQELAQTYRRMGNTKLLTELMEQSLRFIPNQIPQKEH